MTACVVELSIKFYCKIKSTGHWNIVYVPKVVACSVVMRCGMILSNFMQ